MSIPMEQTPETSELIEHADRESKRAFFDIQDEELERRGRILRKEEKPHVYDAPNVHPSNPIPVITENSIPLPDKHQRWKNYPKLSDFLEHSFTGTPFSSVFGAHELATRLQKQGYRTEYFYTCWDGNMVRVAPYQWQMNKGHLEFRVLDAPSVGRLGSRSFSSLWLDYEGTEEAPEEKAPEEKAEVPPAPFNGPKWVEVVSTSELTTYVPASRIQELCFEYADSDVFVMATLEDGSVKCLHSTTHVPKEQVREVMEATREAVSEFLRRLHEGSSPVERVRLS